MSRTMNRVINCLGVLTLIAPAESQMKWGKESRNQKVKVFKDRIEKYIVELECGSENWKKVMSSILEGFVAEKKKSRRVTECVPFASVSHSTNGRVFDRVALLACALADTDLVSYWTYLAKPVTAKARPGSIQIFNTRYII